MTPWLGHRHALTRAAPATLPLSIDDQACEEGSKAPDPVTAGAIDRAIEAAGHDPAELPKERADWWRGRGRRMLLPDDWALTVADRTYARDCGLDAADEVRKMANHVRAKGVRMADWSAYFLHWCDMAPKFAARPSRPRSAADATAERYFGRAAA